MSMAGFFYPTDGRDYILYFDKYPEAERQKIVYSGHLFVYKTALGKKFGVDALGIGRNIFACFSKK